jgi:glycosyltransferase involved in cell wall biosynthesis
MRLLMVVQGPTAVATRYRALAYRPHLEARGWRVEVLAHDSSARGRLHCIRRARAADLVFVQKKRLPGWQLRAMKSAGARLVYDVDDAVMLRSSRHAARTSATRRRRFETALRHADLVLAGNAYLASLAGASHPRVAVQPLPFDVGRLPTRVPEPAAGRRVLGWIGGGKSLPFLEALAPVLERVGKRHPEVSLHVVCDRAFALGSLRVVHRPWSLEGEAAEVAAFDIGLAPLPDDAWARGKCGTKLLQCFCAAVPVVASPVGVQAELVEPEVTGLWARDAAEWEAALERLLRDAALRRDLGAAGRAYAERHHALSLLAPRFESLLRGALGRTPGSP